jgi:nitroimidazol reductase NimA-like FMN-containing flavoprotein (pyridoxamine 5'-phosphate oxidase superfamily)
MTDAEIEVRLAGPHTCVFSVARLGKGPVSVPLAYVFRDGRFYLQSDPKSLHGRLAVERGRATVTVHDEWVGGVEAQEWYVTAEGPVAFTDDPLRPLLREIMAKDRGEGVADRWVDEWLWPAAETHRVLVLDPERIAGYGFPSRLET